MKTPIAEKLQQNYNNYYILLDDSLLGKKFDIIECLSTRESHTEIKKANGDGHWFAASIEWGLKEKWFVPFSHIEFAKLHVQEALKQASERAEFRDKQYRDNIDDCIYTDNGTYHIDEDSILNAYPLTNIN